MYWVQRASTLASPLKQYKGNRQRMSRRSSYPNLLEAAPVTTCPTMLCSGYDLVLFVQDAVPDTADLVMLVHVSC